MRIQAFFLYLRNFYRQFLLPFEIPVSTATRLNNIYLILLKALPLVGAPMYCDRHFHFFAIKRLFYSFKYNENKEKI